MRSPQVLTSTLGALLLVLTLSACGPTAESAPSDDDTTTETETDSGESTDDTTDEAEDSDDAFDGVTLPGTGEYTVPDQAPIGGFELPDNQDALPDGCTWQVYEDDQILGDSNGPFVFVTDVTTRFVTDGCPDWVQFE